MLKLQQELLAWAEELFGERDMTWNLLPPMFGDRNPHIFYPDPESLKLVMVKLGRGAREKWTLVLFQLSHEVIHLLNPKRGCKANNLEEGVASAFSYYVQRRSGIVEPDFVRHDRPAYKCVHSLVRRLPTGDIAAAKRIRREMPPGTPFSSISTDDLRRIFPDVDAEHADALASMFCRDKTEFP